MFKSFKIIIIFCQLAFSIILGCATVDVKKEINETLYPQDYYEECVELVPGKVLEYSFEASKPVNFNIHYHTAKDIFYPVKRDNVTSLKGTLDIVELPYYTDEQTYFCLMWENPHRIMNVTLRCRHSVVERK